MANKYKVTIPEFVCEVEAESEQEAMVEAFESFNADNSPATDPHVELLAEDKQLPRCIYPVSRSHCKLYTARGENYCTHHKYELAWKV